MNRDAFPEAATKLISPRAIRNYAQALGWVPVPTIDGTVAVFHRPDSDLHQLLVPLDETYDDYSELVSESVRKLAEFEHRSPQEVLDHLLLPPADVFRFRDTSPETDTGSLFLDHAVTLLQGTYRMLSSIAHSVLRPQAYHPRLSRTEAEQFLRSCRMGQTERGSFIMTVACPLDFVLGTVMREEPFVRRVTDGLVSSLQEITTAADANTVDQLTDREQHPLLSANFCEALQMLRPVSERSILEVSVAWSKAIPRPSKHSRTSVLQLRPEFFEAAEYVASELRAVAEPKPEAFVGYVDVLRGQADARGEMSGEVVFSIILEGGESVRARGDLESTDYQIAGDAHLQNAPVFFRGILVRGPRSNRLTEITDFGRAQG